MKVLFCGLEYEYGNKQSGNSFEYQNFYQVLKNMPNVRLDFFATDNGLDLNLRDVLNQNLIKKVIETEPDLVFFFLFTEEIKKETVQAVTKITKTFNWFADDHWRFPIFSKFWAPLFTAVSTTDLAAVSKYASLGIKAIKTQWAANTALYKPVAGLVNQQISDIAFVGKKYGKRGQYIKKLKLAGFNAQGFGKGWDEGVVSLEQMLEIFSNSKINLNFTESSLDRKKEFAKLFVKKSLGKYEWNFYSVFDNLESFAGKQRRQIKGRNFEVPACGGFLLTGNADNLIDYYQDGKEIVIFKNENDLLEKCKYYISHEQERKAIAKAGLARTLQDHTYEKRFKEIFKAMGLG